MSVQILQGDCRTILPTLPADSIDCCVTSPPYWGLRDYGIDCQIGLEDTPEAFVDQLVAVFREVRRALKPTGTTWVNMGDCYNNCDKWSGGGANTGKHTRKPDGEIASWQAVRRKWGKLDGVKPKDLIGQPWMLAFALRADGWYLRAEIIWHKPNPMPESVRDRPTKAHEQIFLLSKSPRYFYDADAIKEPAKWPDGPNSPESIKLPYGQGFTRRNGSHQNHSEPCEGTKANARSVWAIATQPYPDAHFATFPKELAKRCILAGCPEGGTVLDPFAGSGTVGQVAQDLGHHAVLIEANPAYIAMIERRCAQQSLLGASA